MTDPGISIPFNGRALHFISELPTPERLIAGVIANQPEGDLSFTNCPVGIEVVSAHADISHNNFSSVEEGILCRNAFGYTLNITENEMTNAGTGVRLMFNDPASGITVQGNEISTSPGGIGIRVEEQGNGQPEAAVKENTITGQMTAGIRLNNASGYEVSGNTVQMNNSIEGSGRAIQINNCSNLLVEENSLIGGSSPAFNNIGLDVQDATNSQYHCNYFHSLKLGARFLGACNNMAFSTSQFHPPFFGPALTYEDALMTSQQIHTGNRWYLEDDYYGAAAINRAGSLNNLLLSRYIVNEEDPSSQFPTPDFSYHPSGISLPNLPGTPVEQWFPVDEMGNPLICIDPPGVASPDPKDIDLMIAGGTDGYFPGGRPKDSDYTQILRRKE